MVIASIDVGTNTILLLVAEVDAAGRITPLIYEQRVPRLGKGVDAARRLHPDAMRRATVVLGEYRALFEPLSPVRVAVCATSAVRDASNRAEFAALVRADTGLSLEILSGEEEARWTYRGAISGIPEVTKAAVLDIGGGSTELSLGDDTHPVRSLSMDIGSVRLTERFFSGDRPTKAQLEAARVDIQGHIRQTGDFDFRDHALVAVAGTATTLAILDQDVRQFSIRAVTNYRLTLDRVRQLLDRLSRMTVGDIRGLSDIMEGRADVIVAGALILCEVMETHGFREAIVSERGVRYGIALREFERARTGP